MRPLRAKSQKSRKVELNDSNLPKSRRISRSVPTNIGKIYKENAAFGNLIATQALSQSLSDIDEDALSTSFGDSSHLGKILSMLGLKRRLSQSPHDRCTNSEEYPTQIYHQELSSLKI